MFERFPKLLLNQNTGQFNQNVVAGSLLQDLKKTSHINNSMCACGSLKNDWF